MTDAAQRRTTQTTRGEADGDNESRRCRVGIGEHVVATGAAVLVTSGLGSCVGVCIYDDEGRGGLAHCMLPAAEDAGVDDSFKPAKYVDTGIETLQSELIEAGATSGDLRAKVAGGSDMLGLSDGPTVGERNVAVARAELEARAIQVVAADTGGGKGRSLAFEIDTGTLGVTVAGGSTDAL